MNNKVVIGIVVVVVAVLAIFLLSKSGSLYSPSQTQTSTRTPQPSITSTTQQQSPTNEVTKEQNVITLTQAGFSPSTLTVKAGTKISWINNSGSGLSVNSNPHPIHTNYSPLNIGAIGDGQSKSLIFDKPGTYGYHNHLNPSQTGTIVVQ